MNEEEVKVLETEEVTAPVEQAVEPPSLRDTIKQISDDIKEKPEVKAKIEVKKSKIKEERPRDDSGKFLTKEDKSDVSRETPVVPELPEVKMPKSYSSTVMGRWKELPREIQQELSRREDESQSLAIRQDEERMFGKQLKEVISPYMPQIRAEGADPIKAVAELLNTAHLLRTGTPQQKGELLWRTAQTFGADMRQTTQQAQAPFDPRFHQLSQELQGVKTELQKEREFKKQQEDSEIQRLITTFAADPNNVHYEAVKAHMASLLQGGLAKDLQDAYDQAVYANPQTRSTLLEQHKTVSQEQRVADQKARADAARRAGSSVKGAPGIAATKNGKIEHKDLSSTIRAAFAEHRGEA